MAEAKKAAKKSAKKAAKKASKKAVAKTAAKKVAPRPSKRKKSAAGGKVDVVMSVDRWPRSRPIAANAPTMKELDALSRIRS